MSWEDWGKPEAHGGWKWARDHDVYTQHDMEHHVLPRMDAKNRIGQSDDAATKARYPQTLQGKGQLRDDLKYLLQRVDMAVDCGYWLRCFDDDAAAGGRDAGEPASLSKAQTADQSATGPSVPPQYPSPSDAEGRGLLEAKAKQASDAYYRTLLEEAKKRAAERGWRVAVVACSPTSAHLPAAAREAEIARDGIEGSKLGSCAVLTSGTPLDVFRTIADREAGDAHILQLIGHADVKYHDGLETFVFTDDAGTPHAIPRDRLAARLGAHGPGSGGRLELVVLMGCESYGLGRAVQQSGVPFVVSWRTKLLDAAAPCFTKEFYRGLGRRPGAGAAAAGAGCGIAGGEVEECKEGGDADPLARTVREAFKAGLDGIQGRTLVGGQVLHGHLFGTAQYTLEDPSSVRGAGIPFLHTRAHPDAPCNIPEAQKGNQCFFGRATEKWDLYDALTRAMGGERGLGVVAVNQQATVGGLGGIGKSKLAIEAATEFFFQGQFPGGLLYVNAGDSALDLELSFRAMVTDPLGMGRVGLRDEKDFTKIVDAAHLWFKTHSQWLFLVNNANDLAQVQCMRILPPCTGRQCNGSVLLTSRASVDKIRAELGGGMDAKCILLRKLREEDACRVMLGYRAIAGGGEADEPVPGTAPGAKRRMPYGAEGGALRQLATHKLDGLPLALKHAGAYVGKHRLTWAKFLEMYDVADVELMAQQIETQRPLDRVKEWLQDNGLGTFFDTLTAQRPHSGGMGAAGLDGKALVKAWLMSINRDTLYDKIVIENNCDSLEIIQALTRENVEKLLPALDFGTRKAFQVGIKQLRNAYNDGAASWETFKVSVGKTSEFYGGVKSLSDLCALKRDTLRRAGMSEAEMDRFEACILHVDHQGKAERSVATTWAVHQRKLSEGAKRLMRSLSLVASDDIPMALVAGIVAAEMDSVAGAVEAESTLAGEGTGGESKQEGAGAESPGASSTSVELKTNRRLAELETVCLIERSIDGRFSVHRLLQQVTCKGMDKAQFAEAARGAAMSMGALLQKWGVNLLYEQRLELFQIVPHVTSLLSHDAISIAALPPEILARCGRVAHDLAAIYEAGLGKYKDAHRFLVQSLEMRRKVQGTHEASHQDIVASLQALGRVCISEGKYQDARRFITQSFDELKYRGNDTLTVDPDIAKSLCLLGKLCHSEGNFVEAHRYYEKSLAMERQVHGGDDAVHPSIASSLRALGGIFKAQGNPEEARRCYEESLAMEQRIHVGADAGIAASLFALGNLSFDKVPGGESLHPLIVRRLFGCYVEGNLKAARRYYVESLAILHKIHGKDNVAHPDVASLYYALGNVCRAEGTKPEAQGYYDDETFLAMNQNLHGGPDAVHPSIAALLRTLGRMHFFYGNFEQALVYYHKSLTMFQKLHGGEEVHPDTAGLLFSLGYACVGAGKLEEAHRYIDKYVAYTASSWSQLVVGCIVAGVVRTGFVGSALLFSAGLGWYSLLVWFGLSVLVGPGQAVLEGLVAHFGTTFVLEHVLLQDDIHGLRILIFPCFGIIAVAMMAEFGYLKWPCRALLRPLAWRMRRLGMARARLDWVLLGCLPSMGWLGWLSLLAHRAPPTSMLRRLVLTIVPGVASISLATVIIIGSLPDIVPVFLVVCGFLGPDGFLRPDAVYGSPSWIASRIASRIETWLSANGSNSLLSYPVFGLWNCCGRRPNGLAGRYAGIRFAGWLARLAWGGSDGWVGWMGRVGWLAWHVDLQGLLDDEICMAESLGDRLLRFASFYLAFTATVVIAAFPQRSLPPTIAHQNGLDSLYTWGQKRRAAFLAAFLGTAIFYWFGILLGSNSLCGGPYWVRTPIGGFLLLLGVLLLGVVLRERKKQKAVRVVDVEADQECCWREMTCECDRCVAFHSSDGPRHDVTHDLLRFRAMEEGLLNKEEDAAGRQGKTGRDKKDR